MKNLGFFIMLAGIFFACWESVYFGANFYPKSLAELICDGVAFFITCIGVGLSLDTEKKHADFLPKKE